MQKRPFQHLERVVGLLWQQVLCRSVDQVKVFAWLKTHSLAGRDTDLGAGARVASHPGLTGFDGKDAEASQLDSVALGQRALHGLEDGVYGGLGLDARESRAFDDPLDEILLDQ
jgi:hypothetical protein